MPDLPLANDAAPMEPDAVSRRSFPTVRRGLDPEAVGRFLDEVAAALRVMRAREEALRVQLADAERRAAAPVLDEETLTAAVGSETAKVLRAAHEAAREVLARAEARAADLLTEAGAVLGERTREAEAEARSLAARSRAEATALAESTKAECRTMVEEAREARRRILADLAERRRMLHVQLEQLRAGKDALAEVVEATARSVDEVRAKLVGSESEARLAADRAAQVAAFEHDDVSLDALVDEALSALAPLEAPASPRIVDAPDEACPGLEAPRDTSAGPTPRGEGGTVVEDGDVAPADGTGEDGAEGDGARTGGHDSLGMPVEVGHLSAVDDLFARLRAGRAEDVADPAGPGAPEPQDDPVPEGRAAGPELEQKQAPDELGADPVEHEEALVRRDELLAPVLADLARILKRELRSDQNELLDSLRHLERGAEPGSLVPGDATTARLAAATTTALADAWRAGAVFGSPGGDAGEGEPGPQAAQAAQELALEVVASLRSRLEGALADAEDDGAVAELVGAAYRQWRGERVEDLAGDYVTRAFSLGLLGRIGDGALVSWVVDDGKDHCPDCDDNALAGPQAAGQAFPTGQAHPPVHPGCRCALVPTGA